MDYSGINAKIKAMRSGLLGYEDFESLSALNTVEQLGSSLKERRAYGKALGSLDGHELSRGNIEHRLFISLLEDFSRIYKFISGFNYKKYAKAYILRYEINVLQILLSIAFDERDISYSYPNISGLFGGKLTIDVQRLATSRNVPEFIENLRGTQYYPALDGAFRAQTSLFEMETKLDIYYYIHLWKLQNKYLDKNNIRVLSAINGAEIDLRNLMWLYRLKKYYRMNGSSVYSYLIPVQHFVTRKQIVAIAEANTESELINGFMNTKYGEALLAGGEIERNFAYIMDKVYKSVELKNPYSLAPLASYLHSKAQEISNLTKLTEGIKYGLKSEEILARLNTPLRGTYTGVK